MLSLPSYQQRRQPYRCSAERDAGHKSGQRVFKKALTTANAPPEKVTTEDHDFNPRAIREALSEEFQHRTSRYLNNRVEQDHGGIKGQYKEMRNFKSFGSAQRFCDAYDGLRDYLHSRVRPYLYNIS